MVARELNEKSQKKPRHDGRGQFNREEVSPATMKSRKSGLPRLAANR
jgi:hypothetical protein